jgi:hypothetical protein
VTDSIRQETSARIVGVVWLLYFVTAFSAAGITKGIVVPGDAAATAANILAHGARYRAGFALDLVSNSIYVALTALLYGLFRPVNRRLARLAAFFSFAGCIVQIVGGLLRLAPPALLTDPHLSSAFSTAQLQAASLFAISFYARVFDLSFVLFALFELATGALILESRFLPKGFARALGWLWIVAGAGWLTFLWPPLAGALHGFILAAGGLAEIVLMLWLLVRGSPPVAQ